MGTEILRPQDCLMRIVGGSSTTSIRRNPSTNSSSSSYDYYYYYSNPNPNPQKFYRKSEQRKQPQQQHRYLDPQSEKDTTTFVIRNGFRSSIPATTKSVVRNESTTTVKKVLKRGESVDNFIKFKEEKNENLRIKRSVSGDLSCGFSSVSGSSSDNVVDSEIYAGNAFYCSPPPSSLPLPTFSIKKEAAAAAISIIDDSATKDLRRLLRLD